MRTWKLLPSSFATANTIWRERWRQNEKIGTVNTPQVFQTKLIYTLCYPSLLMVIVSVQKVIRAKVLSHGLVTENNKTRVYNLRIQKVYKGEENLNQTDDIRPYGSHQRSLFAKAYTPVSGARCGVKLDNNTLYLLSGTIRRRKLQLSRCKWFLSWSTITSRQRKGIRGSYAKNCGDM